MHVRIMASKMKFLNFTDLFSTLLDRISEVMTHRPSHPGDMSKKSKKE